MIGVFRWGYGAGFEAIAFWGWVEEGVERGGFVHSIVVGGRACLIAHDMEMRRETLRSEVMKCVSAQVFGSAASPGIEKTTVSHERRKAAFSQAEKIFKTENKQIVQKNVANVNRPKAAEIRTPQATAESVTETKTVKR